MIALGLGGVVLAISAGQMLSGGGSAPTEPKVVAQVVPLRVAAGTPAQVWQAPVAEIAEAQAETQAASMADPCAMSLEVFAEEGAMLGVTLLAPCQANARVVLRHGGLAVSMQTLATGSLFATLPALDIAGAVEARFDDGTALDAAAVVPELAGLRRFAVQWQEADRFALNGFEGKADYGDAGHRTAANGGVLALGDPASKPALLAEVYTFPDPETARVSIEAEVSDTTCGRELLGETLFSAGGAVQSSDLTLAMPECDAMGGFVVLNNPLPDMTLAAAE
ncbi:hypothetical protein HYN69_16655 [Gemmobacter aquarius]|uniref:Translocase n=2 Tax=Paragemmobacter aquarius TaxID=2169400 RepID=A0A2S0UQ31_9RHOB|nr:hypothetical protein HYN69_16655 [Gemmobacter aquarius]